MEGVNQRAVVGVGEGNTHLRCMNGNDSDTMNEKYADATRTMMRRMVGS
jgi:hypothetical protein